MILTKSLSRFSRNTLDSITYIRLLKSLNVAVEFEKEGLNTSDVSSEIYLTWFSAFAQAESESISQNVTMGMRRRYKEGKFAFHYSHFLGYRKGEMCIRDSPTATASVRMLPTSWSRTKRRLPSSGRYSGGEPRA